MRHSPIVLSVLLLAGCSSDPYARHHWGTYYQKRKAPQVIFEVCTRSGSQFKLLGYNSTERGGRSGGSLTGPHQAASQVIYAGYLGYLPEMLGLQVAWGVPTKQPELGKKYEVTHGVWILDNDTTITSEKWTNWRAPKGITNNGAEIYLDWVHGRTPRQEDFQPAAESPYLVRFRLMQFTEFLNNLVRPSTILESVPPCVP